MKVAIYMRVSTDDQTNENQRIRLEEFANQRGWDIEGVYEDQESGGKRNRPGLDKMLSTARSGKIGKVIAVKVDRIARSLQDLLEIAGKLGNYNVDSEFTDQDVDISSSQGKLMFQILGAFAEYELKIVGERTKAGLRRAKNEGKKLGRPKIHGSKAVKVMSLLEEHPDWGYRRIANEVGISPASVTRIVKRVSKRGSEKSPGSTTGMDTVSKSCVLGTGCVE